MPELTTLVAAVLGFALTLPLSWVSLALGRRFQLLDRPGAIKTHPQPVPYTGGAAIIFTLCVGGTLLGVPTMSLVGGVVAWLIGFMDDVEGVTPTRKLLLLLLCLSVGTAGLDLDPLARISLLLGGLVLVNAFNVIDGLDGLAGGVAMFGFMALAVGDSAWGLLAAVGIGSLAAFLLFNLHPAVMFLGNQGSLAVGYFLWVAPAHLYANGRDGDTLVYAAIVWTFPLLNLAFVIGKRAIERRPILVGDRSHLYDVLHRRLGLRTALVVCWMLAAASAVIAVATRT
jgi:UDP-GlcNAc:undecaprenyl-phosphate/decaprenyl-phosphate GlcNAc-1-phosphate transferase